MPQQSKASPTSIVAVLLVVSCMAMLFYISEGKRVTNDTISTQIITGVFGLLMAIAGYYFGASKKDEPNENDKQDRL